MMTMNCHEAAIEYATMGFSVIPVSRDKKPLIKWAKFQKRIATSDELSTWRQRWPEANVAIVTGGISGIAVVDADGKQGERWIADNARYSRPVSQFSMMTNLPDRLEGTGTAVINS